MEYINIAWQWIAAHPLYAWIALSIVINLLLRLRSTEQWVELCEKSPRIASIIRLLRAVGIDPVKALEAGIATVNGKARVDIIPPTIAVTPSDPKIEEK